MYFYSSTHINYNLVVLLFYLSISIFYHFIFSLHYNLEAGFVLLLHYIHLITLASIRANVVDFISSIINFNSN